MKIQCQICKNEFKSITTSHLKHHNTNLAQYMLDFPNNQINSDEVKKKLSDNAKLQNSVRDYSTQGVNISKTKKAMFSSGELTIWNKGVPMEEDQKEKLSSIFKDQFKNGRIPWFKGKTHSEEIKKKISDKCKGYRLTDEQKDNLVNAMKLIVNNPLYVNSMKGKTHSNESKKKISESLNLRKDDIRKIMEEKGLWIPLDQLSEFDIYKRYVWSITNKNVHLIPNYDESIRGLCDLTKNNYQVDHKFSITQGFKHGINPEIIGDIVNLQFIPWQENLSKWSSSDISIEELYELYIQD